MTDDTPDLHYFCGNHSGMGCRTSIRHNYTDLTTKDGHPGHKHKPDVDKGTYELRVEHDQDTDGAVNIDDVMGVLSRSRGIEKNDEWRFYDKSSNTSLWDNASKMNKMDIVLEDDKDIELSAILRGDVNASYKAISIAALAAGAFLKSLSFNPMPYNIAWAAGNDSSCVIFLLCLFKFITKIPFFLEWN